MAIDFTKYGTPLNQQPVTGVSGQQINTANTPKVTTLPVKEEKFFGMSGQDFVAQPKYKQYAEAFIATLPKDVADYFSGVLKLGKSVAEVPQTALSVGKEVPDYGGYISQSKKALDKGAKPFGMEAFVKPVAETAISGLEAYGMAKMVDAYGKMKLGQKALNQTSSSLTNLEKKTASARTLTGSPLTGVKEVPGNYSKQVAKVAEPYISNNIVKTENNLKGGIKTIASKLSNDIDKVSKPLNQEIKDTLLQEIDNINPTILTKADPVKNTAFNEFKNRIITIIGTAKNDSELFNIRKGLDDLADVESGGKMWEESGRLNPIYEQWRQSRKLINNLIENRIPGTASSLKTQSLLYDALEGVAEKTGKLLQKPGIINQVVKNGLKWGTTLAIGGAGGYAVNKVVSGK